MTSFPDVSMVDRIPPSNLEAEMALLGSILVDRDLFPRVAAIISFENFYASLHATVWQCIDALYAAGEPIDKVSLAEELRRRNMLDKVGGLAYITSLMETVPTAASAEYYAKVVVEKSRLRELIHIGSDTTRLGYEGEDDAEAAITTAFGRMQKFVDATAPTSRRPMTPLEASIALEERFASGRGVAHPTPFPLLTKRIAGWIGGTLIVLGGSPKMAKSFLANTISFHLAMNVGPVAMFPLEIGRDETQMRSEQTFSGVNAMKRQRGETLTDYELMRLAEARKTLAPLPIHLFDGYPQFTTDDVIVAIRRLHAERPLAGAIIDHVGFLRDIRTGSGKESKHERVEQSLAKLLETARALNIPIFVVWHVNRQAKDGEPTIFDLRDGGNVEGYAHHILFVHRPHWDQNDGTQREGKIIIAATRSGYAGHVPVYFDDKRGVWCDADQRAFFDPQPPQNELLEYSDEIGLTNDDMPFPKP